MAVTDAPTYNIGAANVRNEDQGQQRREVALELHQQVRSETSRADSERAEGIEETVSDRERARLRQLQFLRDRLRTD